MGCGASTDAGNETTKSQGLSQIGATAPQKAYDVPKRMRKGSVADEIAAMDDGDLTLGVDVESWLSEIGMEQYFDAFVENGYDDIETVELMDETDIRTHVGVEKQGHVMKLVKQIAQLKADKFNPGGTPKTPGNARKKVSLGSIGSGGSDDHGESKKVAVMPRFRKGSVAMEIAAMDDDPDLMDALETQSQTSGTSGTSAGVVASEELAEGQTKVGAKKKKKNRRASVVEVNADDDALAELQAEMASLAGSDDRAAEAGSPSGGGHDAHTAHIDINDEAKFNGLELGHLTQIAVLGIGTFSKVTMVQISGSHPAAGPDVYALKKMKKKVLEVRKQTEHLMNEKVIMQEMRGHPFLLQLVTTFKDTNYLYMLMELCQGGELFLRLLEEQVLSEDQTQFYAGCIVLALEGLHGNNNIYRDLKPENILLDSIGYVKIADLGFAKKVKDRTFTRCGTPEYVSPEMLGRMGHNKATDYWSLGIFLYECLHGTTPFAAKNYLSTYKKIAAYAKHPRLKFRNSISKDVQLLMKGLMYPKPGKRLGMLSAGDLIPAVTEPAGYAPKGNTKSLGGMNDILEHAWFKSSRFYNSTGPGWHALRNKKAEAPFVPDIKGPTDTTYFQPEDGPHVTDAEDGEKYDGDGSWFADF